MIAGSAKRKTNCEETKETKVNDLKESGAVERCGLKTRSKKRCKTAEAISTLLTKYEPISPRLRRRDERFGFEGTCNICSSGCDRLEVAYVWDLQMPEQLLIAYQSGPEDLPIGIEDTMNGLLLCPTCHSEYSGPERRLNITADGTIVAHGFVHDTFRKELNGKKVPWAGFIGQRHFPSISLLEVTFSQQHPAGKCHREREHDQRTSLYNEVCQNGRGDFDTVELENDGPVKVCWDKHLTRQGHVRCGVVGCERRCRIAAPELDYLPVCWEHVMVTRVSTK